jgi:hypothetical protein
VNDESAIVGRVQARLQRRLQYLALMIKESGSFVHGRARVARRYAWVMCRNIRTLYNFDPPATEEELRAAALQYVRKISGFTKPSRANEEAFARAIDAVAAASSELLDELRTTAPAKNREAEAAKRRARSAQRYAA